MSIRQVAVTTAVLALAGAAATPSASADPEPTLGQAWSPNQQGYGTVQPFLVSVGGFQPIRWTSRPAAARSGRAH